MVKIAFIGAGSMTFATKLVGDMLTFPALDDSEFALMDIDGKRLQQTARVASEMVEQTGGDARIEATTDRQEALHGADYVLNMINVGGTEPFENEIRIPESYGVEQAIGDTLGPGGIFRGLRTLPTMLDIARDMETHCPDALLLNYTNPMAILCWAMFEATSIETVGLCHSVQHTIEAISEYLDVPADEIEHWVAGINHMAWVLTCEHDGEDLCPRLRDAMDREDIYEQDTVRFELLDHFGAFPTESSHHNSEYHPYFRTDEDRIEELSGTGYAERMETATYLDGWKERSRDRDDSLATDSGQGDDTPVTVERSEEYASRLIDAIETDTPRRLNLNVSNRSVAITNLPDDACVEVPCLVDGTGVHPCTVGDLPPQLADLNRSNIGAQRLAVEGFLDEDRERVFQAVKRDPLTAAALTLPESQAMTEDLCAANAEYLPAFLTPEQ
jgi:alpha-galactosidase